MLRPRAGEGGGRGPGQTGPPPLTTGLSALTLPLLTVGLAQLRGGIRPLPPSAPSLVTVLKILYKRSTALKYHILWLNCGGKIIMSVKKLF